MSHKNKPCIHQDIKAELRSKERFGESKHIAKINGTASEGIYSYITAKVYNRECHKFGEYVEQVSPQGRHTRLSDAKVYAKDYIEKMNNDTSKSAYSVKLARASLAKLYNCNGSEFGEVRKRSRANITRSRNRTAVSEKTGKTIKNPSTRAGHFSEKKHVNEVTFAKSTGLRRSELEQIKGNQFFQKNGNYYIRLEGYQCKGGRTRVVPVLDNNEKVKELCEKAGDKKVFDKIPKMMDVHSYRSNYATALYKQNARDLASIPRNERYCCRNELKGVVYDKKAMKVVTEALGHNRISVIAEHYLR